MASIITQGADTPWCPHPVRSHSCFGNSQLSHWPLTHRFLAKAIQLFIDLLEATATVDAKDKALLDQH